MIIYTYPSRFFVLTDAASSVSAPTAAAVSSASGISAEAVSSVGMAAKAAEIMRASVMFMMLASAVGIAVMVMISFMGMGITVGAAGQVGVGQHKQGRIIFGVVPGFAGRLAVSVSSDHAAYQHKSQNYNKYKANAHERHSLLTVLK